MRQALARHLYQMFPFDTRGDCLVPEPSDGIKISCIINFYGRLDLLSGILSSLSEQQFPRRLFEVVLVEDRGGTSGGQVLAEEFSARLPIVYVPLDRNYGNMGYSRNFGLFRSRGEYLLFLDDDTVLLQNDFLRTLLDHFEADPHVDALVPRGEASFALIKERYCYHEPFFMTSRCTAYRRDVLADLQGFIDDFIGQEDVEFVIRFFLTGHRSRNLPELHYYHPPFLVGKLNKPMAVGRSFARLRRRYPRLLWLLVLANCGRHAPLCLLPGRRCQEMGRFGVGFFLGVVASWIRKKGFQYV